MQYTFDLGSFFLGLAIIVGGTCIAIFYRQVADNLAHGVSSYDRVKLFGILAIILGFLVATNLHTVLLTFLVGLIFPK
jgi:hypothetical protein